ncbi:MAG: iron-siderophore ABC transporter substrate-binding protein, partial [Deinococcota bacterium]
VQRLLTDITDVGYFPPNLESVTALQPDLIIAGSYLESIDQLKAIAPTVVLDFESTVAWKNVVRLTGELFGLSEFTDALFAEYEARIDSLNELVGDPANIEVSIVRLQEDSVNLMLGVFSSTIIEDAGFSRPTSQAYSAAEAAEIYGNSLSATISLENLQLADADYIFVWGAFYLDEVNTFADGILENPLWQSLEAVQSNRAYRVGEHWIGRGFYGAHMVIDDLFVHVAEVDPAEVAPNPFK